MTAGTNMRDIDSIISTKHIKLIVNQQESSGHYLTRKFLFLDNEI